MSDKKAYTKKQKIQRAAEAKSVIAGLAEMHHEIFSQLMQIPQAKRWVEENIRIMTDVDQDGGTIDIKVAFIGDPEQGLNQNVVTCPGCQVKFDANAKTLMVQLATKIPNDIKLPGEGEAK